MPLMRSSMRTMASMSSSSSGRMRVPVSVPGIGVSGRRACEIASRLAGLARPRHRRQGGATAPPRRARRAHAPRARAPRAASACPARPRAPRVDRFWSGSYAGFAAPDPRRAAVDPVAAAAWARFQGAMRPDHDPSGGIPSHRLFVLPAVFILLVAAVPWLVGYYVDGGGPHRPREVEGELTVSGLTLVLGWWIITLIRR